MLPSSKLPSHLNPNTASPTANTCPNSKVKSSFSSSYIVVLVAKRDPDWTRTTLRRTRGAAVFKVMEVVGEGMLRLSGT
jgi:hypothetical protein